MHYFELAAAENDWQAIFQLGVMYYDGIQCKPDMVIFFFNIVQVFACDHVQKNAL